MRYDVVFVDWDLTLSGSRFWGHWASDHVRYRDNELVQRKFFADSAGLLDGWMRGRYRAEEIVVEVARRTGLDASDLLAGLRESCATMTLYDNRTWEVISTLRDRGATVVIATDNMDTFSRWTVPALGLEDHFDEILNSHELEARKKDKSIGGESVFFSSYFDRHNVDPVRTVLLDDSLVNRAVEDFGMSFVRVGPDFPVLSALNAINDLQ